MERFVVGTGRCGSTLLANMLAVHPEGLMISECLGSADRINAFKSGPVTREQFKELMLSNVPVIDLAVHRGNITKEQQYEVDNATSFKIPAYLYITFPTLSDKPDQLFAEMMALVETFPPQTMTEHYLRIFSWLQQKFGKRFWIERSGSSIEYMPELLHLFPMAKYLHIHRDGPDAALSMSNHFYFQMLVSFFTQPATREELEQTELAGAPIRADDPISHRLGAGRPTPEECAAYWNYQLEIGYQAFAKLDTSQYLDVRFENLISQPHVVLQRIADFFEMPDSPGWIDKAAAMVSTSEVKSSMDRLSAAQQESLLKACQPGRILLGRYQHPWIYPTLQLIKDVTREHEQRATQAGK
jgi:Sulfotransferase family